MQHTFAFVWNLYLSFISFLFIAIDVVLSTLSIDFAFPSFVLLGNKYFWYVSIICSIIHSIAQSPHSGFIVLLKSGVTSRISADRLATYSHYRQCALRVCTFTFVVVVAVAAAVAVVVVVDKDHACTH